MWRPVVWQKLAKVSEGQMVSIFRVDDVLSKQHRKAAERRVHKLDLDV
jgi:hypothetical protein